MTAAPVFRSVDAHTGERSPIPAILAVCDDIAEAVAVVEALRDRNAELEIRVQELTVERDKWRLLVSEMWL